MAEPRNWRDLAREGIRLYELRPFSQMPSCEQPTYAPDIAELFLANGPTGVNLRYLSSLLVDYTPDWLCTLDRVWRTHCPNLTLAMTERLAEFVDVKHGWSVAASLASHANGFIRERALHVLALHRGGEEIPFLVLRANDWVEQVRAAAFDALCARLTPENADAVLGALRSFALLERFRRRGVADLRACIDEFLARPELSAARRRALASRDARLRRALFPRAIAAEADCAAELLLEAARDEEDAIRRWAVWRLRVHESTAACEILLLDRVLDVRQEAQRIARAVGIDVRTVYLQRLADAVSPSAVRGLGETGLPEDAALVASFLSDPRMEVRRAALLALSSLAPDAHCEEFLEALASPSPRLASDAARILARHPHLAEHARDRLLELAHGRNARARHGAEKALEAADRHRRE